MIDIVQLCGNSLGGARIKRSFDASKGWQTTYEYEGTQASINGLLPLVRASKRSFEADLRSPKATLIITTPDSGDNNADPSKDVRIHYDLATNTSQKSLYEHWRTVRFARANFEDLRAIKTGLKIDQPVSGLSGDALEFYNLMQNGQDSFVVSQTVFKVTVIGPQDAELQSVFSNSNVVYSTNAMLGETAAPKPYSDGIKASVTAMYRDFYQAVIPTGYYTPGWLKQSPSINTIAGEKAATVIEFWLESWSQYSYNFAAEGNENANAWQAIYPGF